ncbi:MAG: CheY-like chemotaxis protein [Verrucomicrobiales bacterium]|jgi:CheY-like chemotaxis protein
MRTRILIIDDEVDFTELAQVALERGGEFEVRTLNDATNCLDVAREFKPDLIVSDIVMPNKDGAEIVRELKQDEELKSIPIIVMSALLNNSAVAYKSIGQLDVAQILEKPITLDELREYIRSALKK